MNFGLPLRCASGRAVPQLALRSAQRRFAPPVWPTATAIHPSARRLRRLLDQRGLSLFAFEDDIHNQIHPYA